MTELPISSGKSRSQHCRYCNEVTNRNKIIRVRFSIRVGVNKQATVLQLVFCSSNHFSLWIKEQSEKTIRIVMLESIRQC